MNIAKPCVEEVEKYQLMWYSSESDMPKEHALDKLFLTTYPLNKCIDDVLVKVSVLNDIYGTNLFNTFAMASHIVELDIDERLQKADDTLVMDIAKMTLPNGQVKSFYSFATKYCSRHKPKDYPLYDSYVDKVLRYFRDVDGFYEFKSQDLKDYPLFRRIVSEFRDFYGLGEYDFKRLDMYLWRLGKEKFSKNYV